MGIVVDYRPHETRILQVLSDGLPHHRRELVREGAAAVDTYMAQHFWRNKMLADRRKGKLRAGTQTPNPAESGARMMASAALYYMVHRKLIEPVTIGEERGRKVTETWQITDAGRSWLQDPGDTDPYSVTTDLELGQFEDLVEDTDTNFGGASPTCLFCENAVDPKAKGTWSMRNGWIQSRVGGGANKLTAMSDPIAYAHEECFNAKPS